MSGAGARAAAASLVGTLGADALVLRMAQPPVADSDGEELGLGSPGFQDVVVRPVLLQPRGGGKVLVTVSAETLEAALGVAGSGEAGVEAAVESAVFAVAGDSTLQVTAVERRAVYGRAYLYRLLLVAPALG